MSSDLYRDLILEYYRHPKNFGNIPEAQIKIKESNPLCGDEVELNIKIETNKVSDIKFTGNGCAISMAAASMLTELVKGKTIEELQAMNKKDILNLLGIESLQLNPVRIKCALLPLKALKLGTYSYLGQKLSADDIRLLDNE